ncbi:hypothetical protein W02_00250 [Nitrospira sp. KM1]|nr:hypothetical protein W02_00250 [Nitrospira sp. KM1]
MAKPSLHGLNRTNKAAEIVLATALLAWPVAAVSATDDFGTEVVEKHLRNLSMRWFGIQDPLGASAPPTSGPYRTLTQAASTQVLLADGLQAESVTRSVGDSADMLAFLPAGDSPTHLMFCIEASRQNLGTLLPEGLVQKFNPGMQRVRLRDGAVETLVRGTDGCDGIRRTPGDHSLY